MAIKNVSKGEKITANWANTLVDTVNSLGGADLRGHSAGNSNKNTHRPYQPHSQFLIRKTANLTYTIEAGSIFVDNELIESASTSHFQYSSLMDYEQNCSYTPKNADDLPIWYVDILTTKNEEMQKHIAMLKVKGYLEPFQESTISDYSFNTRYILNTVDIEKKEVRQIFSGSIFLQTVGKTDTLELISLIAGDGIQIDYTSNAYTIKANISVISEDNLILVNQRVDTDGQITVGLSLNNSDILSDQISIIGGDYIRVDYDKNEYTIHNTMNIIGEDGISVSKIDNDGILVSFIQSIIGGDYIRVDYDTNKYTIHNTMSIIAGDGILVSIIDGDGIFISSTPTESVIHVDGGSVTNIIGGDGITVSIIEGDGIIISCTPTESFINVDGIVTMDGNQIPWSDLGAGTYGADLCQLQIDTATFTLRVEKLTDVNGLNFLKFGF